MGLRRLCLFVGALVAGLGVLLAVRASPPEKDQGFEVLAGGQEIIFWDYAPPLYPAHITAPAFGAVVAPGAQVQCAADPISCGEANGKDMDTPIFPGPDPGDPVDDPATMYWAAFETGGGDPAGSWQNGVSTGLTPTWIAPQAPGCYTLQAEPDDEAIWLGQYVEERDDNAFSALTDEVVVYVVRIAVSADPMPDANRPLWWFGGQDAQNYAEQVTLTAEGLPNAGEFVWTVAAGQDYVEFENGQDTITKNNVNTVVVRSTDASREKDDVTIQLTWNGKAVPSRTLTVSAPQHTIVLNGYPQDFAYDPTGFSTLYRLQVLDMLNEQPVPAPLEINDGFFGEFVRDLQGSDWVKGDPNWQMTSGKPGDEGQFTDLYQGPLIAGEPDPMPVAPTHPQAGTAIWHQPQIYRAGSMSTDPPLGRPVKRHCLQFYRGKARQEPL